MLLIEATIPIKPQAFQSTRFGNGHSYSDPKKKAYVQAIQLMLKVKASHAGILKPSTKPLKVTWYFIFEKPKSSKNRYPVVRPDLDNLIKGAAQDAGNGILWIDDSQIVQYGEGTGKYYADKGHGSSIYLKVEEL